MIAFWLTRSDGSDVVIEPERVEAFIGQLSTEVELSGSAWPERSASLSFDVAGVVASVAVEIGNEVRAGDALATLSDTGAQRRVETAEVQLRQAQLRLDDLLTDPEPSAVASANQAIVSARSQVISAEQALALLSEPPSAADLASAAQAVASALAQLSSAEQALALLSEPPSAADLASAEQAVASALAQLSSAEQALALLSEPPSTADLASAEQAVASTLGQISAAEQTLADLIAVPSEAELAELRSAETQAQVQLTAATTLAEELMEALTDAFDGYCERYSGLIASDATIYATCAAILPLSDAQVDALRESFEDRTSTYESFGNTLIDANVLFVAADADRQSAFSGLASAEESLANLLQPVSENDIYQAERSVEAARASHAAAVARLQDLRTAAGEEDIYQAEQSVEAARASHTAAVARLEDLRAVAGEEDIYQAEQSVEAARASHTAAVARLEDLQAAADEGDVEQARASLESALASLASAQANYKQLVDGPSENEIEQQRHDVRLVELSLEEALTDLADLTLFAPFDGIVEAVNVRPGDRIASGFAAFTLSTSSRMLIELTVTEEELLELEVGQTGVASFDPIDGVDYPVRVVSISRVPNTEQGVVTYDVEAHILAGTEVAGDSSVSGIRAAGGFAGGFAAGGFRGGPLAGFELPEGVTIEQVRQALVNGEPLPEGVVLPEELVTALQSFLRTAGAGQRPGPGVQRDPAGQPGGSAPRPLPAPGMSASVTILTEVREQSVLVPVSAVRQLDGAWFVTVPDPAGSGNESVSERIFIEVGASDGTNVEIESGIDAGTVLLIGADVAGIAFSATQQQPRAIPGVGTGGFGPGGGGGRR